VDELGNVYRIIHDKRVALFEEHQEPLLHETVQRILPESIIGYEMVNGLGCAVRNVLLNGLPAGKEYIYRPFALIVKTTAMDPTSRCAAPCPHSSRAEWLKKTVRSRGTDGSA
jgi:hypothetical protein